MLYLFYNLRQAKTDDVIKVYPRMINYLETKVISRKFDLNFKLLFCFDGLDQEGIAEVFLTQASSSGGRS